MKNKTKSSRFTEALKQKTKRFFSKNIALKIASLIFAMLLWGYVLMTQNPERDKMIHNIPVTIEGEADLIARRLTIRGDRDAILDEISARVRTELTAYADLGAGNITAVVNLNGITSRGEKTLPISVTSSTGQVISYMPNTVTLEIDTLSTRRVPVEIQSEGELPEGYYAGSRSLDRTYFELDGAATDIVTVAKAVGIVDFTDRTESINEAVPLTLYDAQGNEINAELFPGVLPSIIVRQDILPEKTVPIDAESAILGRDAIPENYTIVSYGMSQMEVRIVGDAETLAEIESISMETIDVTGATADIQQELALIVPEGVTILGDTTVTIMLNIREKQETILFEDIPIEVEHLGNRLEATLDVERMDVSVIGRVGLLNAISRGDVELYIDLSDMTAGTYTVPVALRLPQDEMLSELSWVLPAETVQVTIQ